MGLPDLKTDVLHSTSEVSSKTCSKLPWPSAVFLSLPPVRTSFLPFFICAAVISLPALGEYFMAFSGRRVSGIRCSPWVYVLAGRHEFCIRPFFINLLVGTHLRNSRSLSVFIKQGRISGERQASAVAYCLCSANQNHSGMILKND